MTRIVDTEHARVGAWMQEQGAGFWRVGATCIGLERDGRLVAAAMYDYFNGASIYAHIAITGKITREWLYAIHWYPFVQLKVNVVIGTVPKDNLKAQRFDEHLGFRLLTEIPDADPSGATLLYIMRHDDARYLKKGHYGKA